MSDSNQTENEVNTEIVPVIVETEADKDNDRSSIDAVKKNIDLNNHAALSMFGRDAKGWISKQSDKLLRDTLNKDSDFVGDLLVNLTDKVSGIDPSSLQDLSFFNKMLGGAKRAVKRFISKFETVASQVDEIAHKLELAKENLRTDIYKLDQLYAQNVGNIKKLNIYILAGTEYIEEARIETIPKMQAKANIEPDSQMANQNIFDFSQSVERFERLLHDLKLSKTMALQMLPQIRVVQNSSTSLVDKLNSSIDLAIPAWKNQMVMALSLGRQKKALRLQQEVSSMTNTLLQKNAEMLKMNALEIEKESQKGIVDVAMLSKVNEELLSTISGVLNIQKEGRMEREKAETELQSIEGQLSEMLGSVEAVAAS